ncbi:MAG TPA: EcsC family protein [Reyranella sp.]|nr:EcsC family protein [Reyranella sp.]
MQDSGAIPLAAVHHEALAEAVAALENPNLAARIADYAGAPVNRVLGLLPKAADKGLTKAVETAMLRCLRTAIRTLERGDQRKPSTLLSSMAVGVTGGVSGFVGLAALPVELPVTTTLMLRAIADIARHNGEDLASLEARLACLQVFALGARSTGARQDVGYYAARALLTRMTSEAAAYLVQRGTLELTGPMMNRLMAELVSRFSIVVSDRIAASSLPVIGAIGGATVNVIFMNHFQQVAKGHFTVRRLERRYGQATVRRHYAELATAQIKPAR